MVVVIKPSPAGEASIPNFLVQEEGGKRKRGTIGGEEKRRIEIKI